MPVACARISTSPTQAVVLRRAATTPDLQCTLYSVPAVGVGVVHQQPRLQVLAVVGEIQPQQFRVLPQEPHARRHSHHVAAQHDGDGVPIRAWLRAEGEERWSSAQSAIPRRSAGVVDNRLDGVSSAARWSMTTTASPSSSIRTCGGHRATAPSRSR